jgi:hypothetical protein
MQGVMGYRLDGCSSISSRGKRFLSPPQCPDPVWILGLLSLGQWGQSIKLVLRSRMGELYLHSPHVFMVWCLINSAQEQIYACFNYAVYTCMKKKADTN